MRVPLEDFTKPLFPSMASLPTVTSLYSKFCQKRKYWGAIALLEKYARLASRLSNIKSNGAGGCINLFPWKDRRRLVDRGCGTILRHLIQWQPQPPPDIIVWILGQLNCNFHILGHRQRVLFIVFPSYVIKATTSCFGCPLTLLCVVNSSSKKRGLKRVAHQNKWGDCLKVPSRKLDVQLVMITKIH